MKRKIILFLIFLIIITNINSLAETEKNPDLWTPEDTMKIAGINSPSLSPDGKKVVYTVSRAIINQDSSKFLSHLILTDIEKNETYQLTYGENSCEDPQWSPDGKLIAFLTKRSKTENIWLIKPDGGEAWQLTDTETGINKYLWSPDGKTIAFTGKDEKTKEEKKEPDIVDKEKMYHLWLVSAEGKPGEQGKSKRLTEGNFNIGRPWSENPDFTWSPDGKTIAFTKIDSPGINDYPSACISTVDIETGEIKTLIDTEASEMAPLYSPDGKWIAFLSTKKIIKYPYDLYIHIIPSGGGPPLMLAESYNSFMSLISWSKDSKLIYYGEDFKTGTGLFAMPVDGSPPVEIINDGSVIEEISTNTTGSGIVFTGQNLTEPEEVYISNLDNINLLKVSRENEDITYKNVGKTELIRWKSKGNLEIEGFLTYPADYEEGKKYPLLLILHGGPSGSFKNYFIGNRGSSPVAVFSSCGYFVLRPNIRGSDGYGAEFRKANTGDMGGNDYKDLISGVEYVIEKGFIDKEKMGIMGWSYGGYLAAWAITQTDIFKAAVVGAGITDFVSYQGTTDTQLLFSGYLGGQIWEEDLYIERSPIFNIEGVKTPVLILHGKNDERVPPSQGYELYYAMKAQNTPVEMVVYPGTDHNPRSTPETILDMNYRVLEWFKKYILEN